MSGYIDNYGSPDNPVADITGTLLQILVNFVPKGTSAAQDVAVLQYATEFGLPPSLITQLQTPLSQTGDYVWSQEKDANGKTMRDRAAAAIVSNISGAVSASYDVGAALPATGILRSIVLSGSLTDPDLSQLIFLSYELIGISAYFKTRSSLTGWWAPDPSFTVTFDAELLMQVGIPFSPGQLKLTSSVNIENADISGHNWTAQLGEAVLTAVNFLSGKPANLFQTAEGQIDDSGGQITANLGPFSALLAQLSTAWQAALPYGFRELAAFIDQSARTLNLRLTHPVDPAPVPVNGTVPAYPSLFPPLLGASSSCVEPGDSLTITGTNFPAGQSTALYIGWQDTTSGAVTESDIMWGPDPAAMQAAPPKPRNGGDGGNALTVTNLAAGTTYYFAVRDQDLLTETPFTEPPAAISTQATDIIDLILQSSAAQWPVGTAQLTAVNSFTAAVQIPAGLAPATYTLKALLNGSVLASMPIQVETACATRIEVIDPVTQDIQDWVKQATPFTLRGAGFAAGTVDVSIDSAGGTCMGSVTIASGTEFTQDFTWPSGVTGSHDIVAQESAGAQTLSASYTVTVFVLPKIT